MDKSSPNDVLVSLWALLEQLNDPRPADASETRNESERGPSHRAVVDNTARLFGARAEGVAAVLDAIRRHRNALVHQPFAAISGSDLWTEQFVNHLRHYIEELLAFHTFGLRRVCWKVRMRLIELAKDAPLLMKHQKEIRRLAKSQDPA